MNEKLFLDNEINLIALYKLLKKYYKFSLKCIIVSFFLGTFYILIATPLYKSEITIYPSVNDTSSTTSMMGDILDIATNVGIELGNSTMASFSIIDIIHSRTVKLKLINSLYQSNNFSNKINLIEYWEINQKSFIGKIIDKFKNLMNSSKVNKQLIWEKLAIKALDERIFLSEEESGLIRVNIYMYFIN